MSVRGLKIVHNPLNIFQTTLFRTSACRRQPSWIWKECLATALLIDIDFIMAGLAYVQYSASENCLQRAVFATYAHRWQKASLRGTEIGVNFHMFSKRYKHDNTVRKTRHEAVLNSTFLFYWDWIKNTQEIRQWKSLKRDKLSYAERNREHFGLPKTSWNVHQGLFQGQIGRFMTADKLKLASLAFSRADREIYDCRQTETCIAGLQTS